MIIYIPVVVIGSPAAHFGRVEINCGRIKFGEVDWRVRGSKRMEKYQPMKSFL